MGVLEMLDILLDVNLAPVDDGLPFFRVDIRAFESDILAALFQCVMWKDVVHKRINKMVCTSIPLAVQEFPLEYMVPADMGT